MYSAMEPSNVLSRVLDLVATWNKDSPYTKTINLAMQNPIIWNLISCKNNATNQTEMIDDFIGVQNIDNRANNQSIYMTAKSKHNHNDPIVNKNLRKSSKFSVHVNKSRAHTNADFWKEQLVNKNQRTPRTMSVKRVLSFNHLEECKSEFSHDNEFESFDIKADNTRSPPPRLIRPKIISTSNLDVCIEPDIIHSIIKNRSTKPDYSDSLEDNMKYFDGLVSEMDCNSNTIVSASKIPKRKKQKKKVKTILADLNANNNDICEKSSNTNLTKYDVAPNVNNKVIHANLRQKETSIKEIYSFSTVSNDNLVSAADIEQLYNSGYKELALEKYRAWAENGKICPVIPDPDEDYVVIVDSHNPIIQKRFQDRTLDFHRSQIVQKRFVERQNLFFRANPDYQQDTFDKKKLSFLLIKAEEDVVGELDEKEATKQLKVCLKERPENFNAFKNQLIKKGFLVVTKKLGFQLG